MSFNFTGTLRYAFAAAVLAVAGSAQAVEYTATPAAGNVTTLNTIEVAFAGVESVSELSYGTTLSDAARNYRVGTDVAANKYVVSVRENLTAGSYTLNIPAGTVALDGNALNEAISLTYNVAGSGFTGATFTPAPGRVSSLQELTVTLNGVASAAYVANSTETAAYLTRDGERVVTFGPYNAVTRANSVTFSCYEPQTAPGVYQLVVPANSLTADGTAVEPFTAEWNIVVPQVTVSPEAGAVTELNNVAFTFNGVSQLTEVNYSGVSFRNADNEAVRYVTSVDGNVFYVKPVEALTPGDYTVTVAAGTLSADGFSFDQELSASYTLTTVAPEYTVSATPATGASLLTLDQVAITFEGIETVASIIESTPQAPYVTREGNRVCTVTSILCEGNVMTLTMPQTITEAGTYEVVVPGSGYTPDGVNLGKDLEFTYNVKGLNYTVTPAAETVASLSEIVLTFEGVAQVSEVGYNVMLTDAQGNAHRVRTSVEGADYKVNVIDPITAAGVYNLYVPANTLALDGINLTAALEHTFTVEPVAGEYTVNATPAAGEVLALSQFVLNFEGANAIACVVDGTEKAASLSKDGQRIATITNYAVEGLALTMTLSQPVTEPGNYQLTVPGIGYTVNGAAGRDLSFDYTVKAVSYTVSPAEAVSTLNEVALTFEGFNAVSEVGYNVSLTDADGNAYRVRTAVEGNVYKALLIDPVSTAGVYTLNLPAGTVALDGQTYNAPIAAQVTVAGAAVNVVANPADGSSLLALNQVAITFEGAEFVASVVESTEQAPYVTRDGNRVMTISNILCEGNVMTLTPYEAFTEAGEYKVVVPGIGYTTDGMNYGQDLEFNYTVKGLNYTFTPEGEVSQLESITFTFEGVTAVSEVGYNVLLVNPVNNQAVRVKTEVSGNTYTVNLIDPLTVAGSYELTIPANTLALDGTTLGVDIVEYFYVVPGEVNFTVSANPAEGNVTSLQTIEVTLEGASNVVVASLNSETAPYLTDAEGNRRATFTNVSAKDNVITIGMYGEYKEAGAVKVVIPAATYTVNGVEAREIVLNYTITDDSGIESVIADAQKAPVRVYNVQGQLINRAADAEAIKALPNGFYIINGKKVVK